jgi:putative flavoprotein involved in K+ transport
LKQALYTLGNIVMIPSVKRARARGVLQSSGSISRLNRDGVEWSNGLSEAFDEIIIWCTGFGYATNHLRGLVDLDSNGKTLTLNTKSALVNGFWLVGYGSCTGFASATLIDVGRSARETVKEISEFLSI